jgi:hypothetical protein
MWKGLQKTPVIIIVPAISAVTIIAVVYYAPRFFALMDKPVKSDVIVLFEGSPDRGKEAHRLLDDGYAQRLIVPVYQFPQYFNDEGRNRRHKTFPSFYENTHIEVLLAERVMKQHGFKSAIFVSSPYHIPRLKLITEKIFNESSSKIVFVPSFSKKSSRDFFHRTISYWNNWMNECIKILWFVIYSSFTMPRPCHL